MQKFSQTPVAKEYSSILKSYPEKVKDFTFQPLYDITNVMSNYLLSLIDEYKSAGIKTEKK